MLIYASHITPRVNYIFSFVLKEIMGLDHFKITSSKEEFATFTGAKINYSKEVFAGAIQVFPVDLLFERGVRNLKLEIEKTADYPYFFAAKRGDFHFDLFAASFYLISRYEEYLPYTPDAHGRFNAEQSLAYQHNFLQVPVVHIWADALKKKIIEKFPNTIFTKRKYQFTPTVDVDNVFAYRGKGINRTVGAAFKDLWHFQFEQLLERLQVITGLKPDPYNTFSEQMQWYKKAGAASIYFMLFSEFGPNDRNISMHSHAMKNTLQYMQGHTEVAIHPSYQSNSHPTILAKEIENFATITHQPVTKSRQHYLKMTLPETYRNLVKLGITNDYSMGYASHPGFRAGVAIPYTFYDLLAEQTLPLTVHPFMLMDVTFIDYQKTTAEHAWPQMKKLISATRNVQGHLITVFHNRVCSAHQPEWQGWPELYQKLLKFARP